MKDEIQTVIMERELPFPPEKIWRALTSPHLLAEWLMQNDFKAESGHRFQFRADWGHVDCKVLAIEPHKSLSYSWDAMGLESVVTWTLSPTLKGTYVKMEHAGFKPEQKQALAGAKFGWQRFLDRMEKFLETAP